jgi:hypothetical protein
VRLPGQRDLADAQATSEFACCLLTLVECERALLLNFRQRSNLDHNRANGRRRVRIARQDCDIDHKLDLGGLIVKGGLSVVDRPFIPRYFAATDFNDLVTRDGSGLLAWRPTPSCRSSRK